MATDPIADMLTHIRNAIAVNKSGIRMPHSKVKEVVAKLLVDNGFLKSVQVEEEKGRKYLVITINSEGSNSVITEISRMSRPGRRLYVPADEIPAVKRGRGIVIVSTSGGVMTGWEAKSKHLGGELICRIY
jgi:small subunit ribosomal protein S8